MDFKNFDELAEIVRGKTNRIIVPGANNHEAMEACKMADDDKLLSGGILIGDKSATEQMAKEAGLSLKKFELVQSDDVAEMCAMAVDFIKHGKGDFLVKGFVDSKSYLHAILNKEAGLVEHDTVLSHFVLFETAHYHKLFALTDAAIMIHPTLEDKRKIVQNAVNVMRILGNPKPKVSVVCPLEKANPKIPSTMDAVELSNMSRDGRIHDAVVEGPYDIYISVSRQLADEKGIKGGQVPGEVDIMMLPNLDSANPVYKSISFFAEGLKSATIVGGANAAIVLPSRTDPPLTKMLSIALAALLKEHHKAELARRRG